MEIVKSKRFRLRRIGRVEYFFIILYKILSLPVVDGNLIILEYAAMFAKIGISYLNSHNIDLLVENFFIILLHKVDGNPITLESPTVFVKILNG